MEFPSVAARFAPSPTGYLHIGNARLALLNWLCARHFGGEFILRIDDTDRTRCQEHFVQAIHDDLKWLGLSWDRQIRQSERQASYDRAIQHLKDTKRLYPCYETAEELQEKRRALLAQKKPPIYDRASLHHPKEHDRPHWRFLLKDEEVVWDDCVFGRMAVQTRFLSDPIVVREDGTLNYMLASVVDDNEYFVSHILRGADHLPNTPIQAQMKRALDAAVPTFGHFPLVSDADGHKFSKREGTGSVRALRQAGVDPLAVCHALVNVGSGIRYDGALADIAKVFDMRQYSCSDVCFNDDMVRHAQENIIHTAHYDDVPEFVKKVCSSELWSLIRTNISAWDDVHHWHRVCTDRDLLGLHPEANTHICHTAVLTLPAQPWDSTTWGTWVQAIQSTLGSSVSQKDIFMTLRQVLTGLKKGPKMDQLLPLMDSACVVNRLNQTSALAPRSIQDV